MKTYYIPTSTLNFNNILSSESISPMAFYAKRGFGYSRWQSVEENNVDNAIILYDKPFEFTRPQSDVEDHPMLIEFVTDEEFPKLDDGIYYCDHTIYLSPWRTNFIFFSERDKLTTLSLSDSSLETKFMTFYRKRFDVHQGFELSDSKQIRGKNIDLNEESITCDRQINKMKGLLYGYYIGAMLSTSAENVATYNILQESQNIFSAVIASIDHKATPRQEERMNSLLSDLQGCEPAAKYLESKLNSACNVDDVISGLINLGVQFPFIDKHRIMQSLLHGEHEDEKQNEAISWLMNHIDSLNRKMQNEVVPLKVDAKEIVVKDLKLYSISNAAIAGEMGQAVVLAWVNEVLCKDEYNGSIGNVKAELSDEVTQKAKEVYKGEWETSDMKSQLNEMRKYVRGADSMLQWGDNLVSAIAAVLSCGDDWEKLLRQMRLNSMCDYRLAFAFYGELVGFANLTRDFTDILFGYNDKKYVTRVYIELFKQLIGFSPVMEQSREGKEVVSQSNDFIGKVRSVGAKIIEFYKPKKKRADLKEQLESTLKENGDNQDAASFIHSLQKRDAWKKGKALDEMSNSLGVNRQNKQNAQREFPFTPEVAEPVQFSIQYIDEIMQIIRDKCVNLEKKQLSTIADDLKYTFEHCEKQNIEEQIKWFRYLMETGKNEPTSSRGKNMTWKNKIYRNVDIDRIINCLEAIFVK